MTRNILVLTCAAALAAGASFAQDSTPPGNVTDANAVEAPAASDAAPTSTASDANATVADSANPSADTSANPPADETPAPAATPAAEPASATVTSMAYATNIANASGGVFKANVGSYPMSHYRSPSRPLPYDQVEAYLKASPSQQLAQNWWGNDQLASTSTASDASASLPATPTASDASVTSEPSTSDVAPSPALPGDTDVGLKSDTSPPDAAPSPVTSNSDPNTAGIGTDSSAVTLPSTNPSNSETQ